ncbi:MAG: tetratricopeptide repeat protein [Agriterribacter sp.]
MNLSKPIFLLFFIFCCNAANGQIDSILALRGKDHQLKAFIDWATRHVLWNKTTDEKRKAAVMKEAKEKFEERGNEKLVREAWFFSEILKVGGLLKQPPGKWEKTVAQLISAAGTAHEKGWYYNEAECRMAVSTIYYYKLKYLECYEQIHRVLNIVEEIGLVNYPEANRFLSEIGQFYFKFADYEAAISFFQKALNVPKPWSEIDNLYNPLNTLALCYFELGQNKLAEQYFKLAYSAAAAADNSFWMGTINGNLGFLYYELGCYDEALLLKKDDFERSIANKEYTSAAYVANEIAIIYLEKGESDKAKKFSEYANHYYDTISHHYDTTNYDYDAIHTAFDKMGKYKRLYLLNKAGGNYRKGYLYLDSFIRAEKAIGKSRDIKIITDAKILVEAEKNVAKIDLLKAKQKKQALLRRGMVAAGLLICVIIILVINKVQTKKNNQVETALLEKKIVAEQLAHAESRLLAFAGLLAEKNDLVEKFKTIIDTTATSHARAERISVLEQLTKTNIFTESDWEEFKTLFNKAYPGFFSRLNKKMPFLSAADTRLVALSKLKLPQKEMASMLGISYDAVRKARQRLKTKINVDKKLSLEDFVDVV